MKGHDKPQDDPKESENKKLEKRTRDYYMSQRKEPFQLLFIDQGEADLERNFQEYQSEYNSVDQTIYIATHNVRAADNDFVFIMACTVVPLSARGYTIPDSIGVCPNKRSL